jgi:TonB family protein
MDWMESEAEFPRRRFHYWFLLILFALFLHYLVGLLPEKYFIPAGENTVPPPITLEMPKGKNDRRPKPVVETSKARKQEESTQEPRYAGEFDNRVKKEMQSRHKGQFRDRQKGGAQFPQGKNGDLSSGPKLSDLMPYSTTPHGLPNVDQGEETILNTQSTKYASFMNRLAEAVYDPWVRHVREVLTNKSKLDSVAYVTVLEIEMNQEGEVTGITIVKGCGIAELDNAPKQAFWERQPFPHPPSQLFQADGRIRFNYQFTVEMNGSFLNIIPQQL